jgi:protein-S-isoprenylcysteine O-methyltransferase Ste14
MRVSKDWLLSKGLWLSLTWIIFVIHLLGTASSELRDITFIGLLGLSIKPIAVTFFLTMNGNVDRKTVRPRDILASIISYCGTILFLFAPGFSTANTSIRIALEFCVLFYSSLILWGVVSLGSSFQVLPNASTVKTSGPYQLVRHPIYSGYIFGAIAIVLVSFSLLAIVAMCLLTFGLLWRMGLEEERFKESLTYLDYKEKVPNRIIKWPFVIPIAVLAAAVFFQTGPLPPNSRASTLIVHLTYPILSLDPTVYDDWGSVFVGNHIYAPLTTDRKELSAFQISKDVAIKCDNAACSRSKMEFEIQSLIDCGGSTIQANEIRGELSEILAKKTWILPNSRECPSSEKTVCISFDTVKDVRRRLENLYFRFGWKKNPISKPFGTGLYCLVDAKKNETGYINTATLKPRMPGFPEIKIIVSDADPSIFDLSLYGLKNRTNGTEIDTQTPLAYYIVKNSAKRGGLLPWESENGLKFLANLFEKSGITSQEKLRVFKDLIPVGTNFNVSSVGDLKRTTLVLPEFLPDCEKLAKTISIHWRQIQAVCKDTSELIQNSVVPGKTNWDAFITPLTPGAAYPGSITDQYFNSASRESYIKNKSNSFSGGFELIGMGASRISVSAPSEPPHS